jgi:hypothetical protein
MRSKKLAGVLNRLTPDEREEMRQERIEHKQSLTAEFQLGDYVGEHIVARFLPTLSTDKLQSRKVIQVSEEDTQKHNELDEAWWNTTEYGETPNAADKEERWKQLLANQRMLEKKYLPNPLKCHLPILNIQNELEFKQGLKASLWDCDMCSYNIDAENIKIYDDEDSYFTVIEFKLDEK